MVQLPFESVTTVDDPSDAMLVETLPEPDVVVIVPPGPVVVARTWPPPAVTDADRPPLPGTLSPGFSSTTLQLALELELVEPDPPEELLLELLELVWAKAKADARQSPDTAAVNRSIFTI